MNKQNRTFGSEICRLMENPLSEISPWQSLGIKHLEAIRDKSQRELNEFISDLDSINPKYKFQIPNLEKIARLENVAQKFQNALEYRLNTIRVMILNGD